VLRDRLDDGAEDVEHALRVCVAYSAVEEADLSELDAVFIAWGKCEWTGWIRKGGRKVKREEPPAKEIWKKGNTRASG
jgi:hypothetical protein